MPSNRMISDAPSIDPVNEDSRVRKATVGDLGSGEHFAVYARALERVVATDVARSTYAQLVDGAPLSQTILSMPRTRTLSHSHPAHEHSELCDGAEEKAVQILDASNLHVLQFDFDLAHRYLAASPGSKAFNAGLIELMATSVHQIGAYIYKLDLDIGSHKAQLDVHSDPPTLFLHDQYKDIDQYPDGVADAVGYWAESQIFGGVILSDRRQQHGLSKKFGDDCFLPWNRGETVYRNLLLLDTEEWDDFEMFLSVRNVHYIRKGGVRNEAWAL